MPLAFTIVNIHTLKDIQYNLTNSKTHKHSMWGGRGGGHNKMRLYCVMGGGKFSEENGRDEFSKRFCMTA